MDSDSKGGRTGVTSASTRVDLGDDLLRDPTVSQQYERAPTRDSESGDASPQDLNADRLRSAKILFNEGILEEAKKHLHQIIISDPHYWPARKLLDEIHESELKQIFSEDEVPRGRRRSRNMTSQELEIDLRRIDTESIMSKLDEELELGLNTPQLSLIEDRDAMEPFFRNLDQNLASATVQDRIDLGVAFLEIGMFDVAARVFRSATRFPEDPLFLSASSLLAYALVLGRHPFEATLVIQPILQDAEAPGAAKIEFFYLMGRAQEALNKLDHAMQWYRQVREVEPRYRDVDERLARLSLV